MVAASKVPMLKLGEYEIWRMRIEQYIQMIDYALWEVIENGATLPITKVVEGVITETPITTVEEKAQKRLEDAKKLLEAIEKRFGGNTATKKTQTNLLKKQYENFCNDPLRKEDRYILIMAYHQSIFKKEHMAWQTDYCIMKEGMPILRGRISVPGMNSSEREMERGYYSAFM
nr:hypothetical protein [Tanacetum cinerariifolium]